MNACLAAAATAISSHSVFAYKLYTDGGCSSGKKWNTSTPVQVKLLYDSFIDYEDGRGITDLYTRTKDLLSLLDDMSKVTRPPRTSSRWRMRSIERSMIVTFAASPSAMTAEL